MQAYQALLQQWRLLAQRLLLALVLFTLCRGIFYLYNSDLLEISSLTHLGRIFWGGLRFDLSAMAYVYSLLLVLSLLPLGFMYSRLGQRVLSILYLLPSSACIILNLGDTVYFRFTKMRTTVNVLDEFAHESVWGFLHFFTDYWGGTLLGLALIAALVFIDSRLRRPEGRPTCSAWVYYPLSLLVLAASALLAVGALRGGYSTARPLMVSGAAAYIERPQQSSLVLNTPFTMIRTVGKEPIPEFRFFAQSEVAQHFTPLQELGKTPLSGRFAGRNLVVLILESFSKEWISSYNKQLPDYVGYTPFLDSLIERSYTFEHSYANGLKSIDAMPSIFSSIIKPNVPFVLSPYAENKLSSLPEALKRLGYTNSFFHGAPRGSMGFDAFTRQIGFEQYFAGEDYGNHPDSIGSWGVHDEEFLQFMLRKLRGARSPFFASVFTLSSHNPYTFPKRYIGRFPKGTNEIHESVGYVDHALSRFFEVAAQQPWYKNTLFVLVADHAVDGDRKEYMTSAGLYRIPIILFDPQGGLVGRDSTTTVQQADLYPTLLDLLGGKGSIVSYGSSAFDTSRPHFAVSLLSGIYQWIEDDHALLFDGKKVTGFYNLHEDPMQTKDLKEAKLPLMQTLLTHLKAYLQDYSWRMHSGDMQHLRPYGAQE